MTIVRLERLQPPEVICRDCRLPHLSPLAGREPAPDLIRGRLASGALAKRSKAREGAIPHARLRGGAPSPGFLRSGLLRSESDLSPQAGRGEACREFSAR